MIANKMRYEIVRLFLDGKSGNIGADFLIDSELINRRSKYKITVEESDLIRMLLAVDPDGCITDGSDLCFIKGLIELQVVSTNLYRDAVMKSGGIITLNGVPYKRILCAAGHARSGKAFFVRADTWSKLNDIMLCGMYPKTSFIPTKTNAYMGMVASNSTPVSTPRIVVIPDKVVYVDGKYDLVSGDIKSGEYIIYNDISKSVEINPFDGAGLVTVECAKRWAKELKLSYIPSAFQFRSIPGIKGCAFTFDISGYIRDSGRHIIVDYWGNQVDCNDGIDLILTESQFKFKKLYKNFDEWYTAFQSPTHGYTRTFNIASVSLEQSELDNYANLAYQHLQTLQLTRSEIKDLSKTTVSRIKKVHSDPQAFCAYRGVRKYNEETGELDDGWNRIPPYFKALYYNPALFEDSFIRNEVKRSIKSMKENAFVGKLLVSGNYEILAPDLYALAQHAFGEKVTGLLRANEVFSGYWLNKNVNEVDMIRNPHVAREHNIMQVSQSPLAKKWFRYQTSTVVTGMYDTAVMKCNGADFDGDCVLTTRNKIIIEAAKREPANTIVPDFPKQKNIECPIDDIVALMQSDLDGFNGNIGKVINPISTLWSLPQTEARQNQIKIMSVVASLTIDSAKTGIIPKLPTSLKGEMNEFSPPYFMRYRKATDNRKGTDPEKYNGMQDCTMNRICFYLEEQLKDMSVGRPDHEFNFSALMSQNVNEFGNQYSEIKRTLLSLQADYNDICTRYDKCIRQGEFQRQFDCFFEHCRAELLSICQDYNKLLDSLIYLYYLDKDVISSCNNKSILWCSFPKQMLQRAKGNFKVKSVDSAKLQRLRLKRKKDIDNLKEQNAESKGINFSKPVAVKDSDIRQIKETVSEVDEQRLLATLDLLSRISSGGSNRDCISIRHRSRNGISSTQISGLAGIDRRKCNLLWAELRQREVITLQQRDDKNEIVVGVNLPVLNGDVVTSIANAQDIKRHIEHTYKP